MAYDLDTAASYHALYSTIAEGQVPAGRSPVFLNYHRAVLFPAMARRGADLVACLGLQPSDKILLVGCGFGWTIEGLIALGYTDSWGTDISAWIQSAKATSERPDIETAVAAVGLDPYSGEGLALVEEIGGRHGFTRSLVPTRIIDEHGGNTGSRNRIISAIGGTPDWVIMEDIAPCLTDSENLSLVGNMKALSATNFAHLCTVAEEIGQAGSTLNWKSQGSWATFFGNDTVVSTRDYSRVN